MPTDDMEQYRSQPPLLPPKEIVRTLKDPTSSGNKGISLHRWVNWIAGFSADFVSSVIDRYLQDVPPASALVLDPFAGVGTTNVEALRRGFHTFGFELNPFAALAARCKVDLPKLNLARFEESIDGYAAFMHRCEREVDAWWEAPAPKNLAYPSEGPTSQPPKLFRTREPFFSRPVELKVLYSLDFIATIPDRVVQQYFRLALGSTMVSFSNYSYEPSLCSRRKLGKPLIDNASVAAAIGSKVTQMVGDARELRHEVEGLALTPQGYVVETSFFHALSHLSSASVDLIVTSPPYLNNYHYVRNTRPQLYWLGFVNSPKDADRLEKDSFGKFWQTVRESQPVKLDFSLPGLEAQLGELRAFRPEKGVYGGGGWANYAASYFNDSYRFFALVKELLKPGGRAVIVVGNSLLQGMEFRVDEVLANIAELQGLKVAIERIRSKRVGDSIVGTGLRQKPQNGRPGLYEAAVVAERR